MGGRSSSSGMTSGSLQSRGRGSGVLDVSASEAVKGFFTDPNHPNWAGSVTQGRAEAANIAKVFADSYENQLVDERETGRIDDIYRAHGAERSIRNVMQHVIAQHVDPFDWKGTRGEALTGEYGLEADPINTLSRSAYRSLRKAVIDEARKYTKSDPKARRAYRSYY